MERLKVYLLITVAFLFSCKSTDKLTLDEVKKARQVYFDRYGIICLYTYDKFGENNSIKVYDRELKLISAGSVGVDPIPFIRSRDSTSITLEYHPRHKKVSYHEELEQSKKYLSSLGRYQVNYHFTEGLEGSAIGDTIKFDGIKLNKNLDSILLNSKHMNIKIALKDFIFKDNRYRRVTIINGIEYHSILTPLNPTLMDNFYTKILDRY